MLSYFPCAIKLRSDEADADQMYTSLNHHAEKMYHPKIKKVFRLKAARIAELEGEYDVLDPMVRSVGSQVAPATRRTHMQRSDSKDED